MRLEEEEEGRLSQAGDVDKGEEGNATIWRLQYVTNWSPTAPALHLGSPPNFHLLLYHQSIVIANRACASGAAVPVVPACVMLPARACSSSSVVCLQTSLMAQTSTINKLGRELFFTTILLVYTFLLRVPVLVTHSNGLSSVWGNMSD